VTDGPTRPVGRRMDAVERRRGLALVGVLLLVAGAAALGTGAYTVASVPHQVEAHNAGCVPRSNCTLESPADQLPSYRWGEVTAGVGAALVVGGAVLVLTGARRGGDRRGGPTAPVRPGGPGDNGPGAPPGGGVASAPNYK